MLVFQYGSNCSENEINSERRLRGDARFLDIALTVDDYELAFDVYSKGRGCAASDIVRKEGGKVWGALYDIPDHLIDRDTARPLGRVSFDAIEGEGTNYRRETIKVRRPDCSEVSALTYVVRSPVAGLKTNIAYVGHIVSGLRQRKVPDGYIAKVKALATANNPEIALEVAAL
jgi:hypothetical protein